MHLLVQVACMHGDSLGHVVGGRLRLGASLDARRAGCVAGCTAGEMMANWRLGIREDSLMKIILRFWRVGNAKR